MRNDFRAVHIIARAVGGKVSVRYPGVEIINVPKMTGTEFRRKVKKVFLTARCQGRNLFPADFGDGPEYFMQIGDGFSAILFVYRQADDVIYF